MGEVDGLRLWTVLEAKGTDDSRQMVRKLVDFAAPILDRIIETFPTYTVHNSKHARNVAELMADILGERLKDLTPLEAAFLILSAYWHDIGMVFKEDERARLTDDPEWGDFLRKHAEAYLAVSGDPKAEPPRETAEWYCRWRHADRVFVYINAGAAQGLSFRWGVVDLREALGNLCRSHNESINRIQANPVLRADFRAGEADLQFCAILLRLADILDFDRSRSPDSVYQYLGFKRRADPRERASDVEWRKHLAAEGFVFPTDRSQGYALDFIAGPDHPAVEHDLRQFLDVIEGEIEQCRSLLNTCSKRWHEFVLPKRIRRESIIANGYRYGEYRFSLDQHQVLDLFMGENLYDSPHVFVREMLQNALDASRLREHLERLRGDGDFKALPIRVSEWVDRDRYRWVRFDDFGTGMDEQIVRDHLLEVGSSYYTSAQYEADKLHASKGVGSDFVPISRFGIGLLSCFIAGDRVEISTLRQLPDGTRAKPVRLSLDGLHGFYTLQTPDLAPALMPTGATASNEESGYRTQFGTSIAIRLDPRKEREPLDLKTVLEQPLLCPPVPMEYEGESIGGDSKELIGTPWCEPVTLRPTPEEIEALLGFRLPEAFRVELQPLDLTRHSPNPEFKGQVALASLFLSEDLESILTQLSSARDIMFGWGLSFSEKLHISARGDLHHHEQVNLAEDPFDLRHVVTTNFGFPARREPVYGHAEQLLQRLEENSESSTFFERSTSFGASTSFSIGTSLASFADHIKDVPFGLTRPDRIHPRMSGWGYNVPTLLLTHNGVNLSEMEGSRFTLNLRPSGARASIAFGILSLTDRLRPDLSVAREHIRGLPWELYSTASLTTRKAAAELVEPSGDLIWCSDPIRPLKLIDGASLGRLLRDPLLDIAGPWANERIFVRESIEEWGSPTIIETRSLNEVFKVLAGCGEVELDLAIRSETTHEICAAALAHRHLNLQVQKIFGAGRKVRFLVIGKRVTPLEDWENIFPPLCFVPFGHGSVLRGKAPVINRDHPFSTWFLGIVTMLAERYPGVLHQIRTGLLEAPDVHWKAAQALQTVNSAIERLGELDSELRPPKSAYLKPSDLRDDVEIAP